MQTTSGRIGWLVFLVSFAIQAVFAGAESHYDPEAIRLNNRGVALMGQQSTERAEEAFADAFKKDPKFSQAAINDGIALYTLQKLDGAERALRQAIALDPNSAQAWYNVGLTQRAANNLGAALSSFQRAASLDPRDADSLYFEGVCCWLELKATDDSGKVIYWSGVVQDDGKGPVDPGAEFYQSLSIDAHGNPADKRNAWTDRATVYVHLIPPGAADTVHYRLKIPQNARGHIHLTARLNYRKFAWINTQFAFAGKFLTTGPNDVTHAYDDRRMLFTASTADVSGAVKSIPNLPIVVMAQGTAVLTVLPPGSPLPAAKIVTQKADWYRWNDYGIGLLLQGDLRAAETAFMHTTQSDANNPDGWVNIGRVRLEEGNLAGATQVLDKALQLSPNLARTHYFLSRVLREQGNYPASIAQLQLVIAQYPYDRVVRNDLGRVLFLQRKYAEARDQFLKAISIDPEDLEANYNLMLCYTGLGNDKMAAAYQERYMRFKADEASQTLTGPYREKHPFDNLERQPIHEHDSVPLAAANANNGADANLVPLPSENPSSAHLPPQLARLSGGAR